MDHSPPVQDFTVNMLNRLSMPLHHSSYIDELPQCSLPKTDLPTTENATTESWTAKPEILVMDSSNKDNRILLVNLGQHDLK